MTNNEKFNALLNNCQHPHAVCDALLAFAETAKEQEDDHSMAAGPYIADMQAWFSSNSQAKASVAPRR